MTGYRVLYSLSLLLTISLVFAGNYYPRVTLKHGGRLSGRRISVGTQIVDQFLGVRYAKPPVADLRFRKPEPLDPWKGVKLARSIGNGCVQSRIFSNDTGNYGGSEDCLFLDINVPRGVHRHARKPVMLWIHGGGYNTGQGSPYIGAPLALHGNVIVVSINYRLNIFGFLTNGHGAGNFGLWDQRAAIQWVKDNIAEFGGDPNSITIFGESAGGGSVAAQMMGQHNNGLFQRGIAQSGSLYQPWGWFTSEKQLSEQLSRIKTQFSCGELDVYACLRNETLPNIWSNLFNASGIIFNRWHPVPDGDFFSVDVENESYNMSTRFDLLAGSNDQEGLVMVMLDAALFIRNRNESIMDGVSLEAVRAFLNQRCSMFISSQSPELCAEFFIRTYNLDQAAEDRDRLIRFTFALGDYNFNADIVNMLQKHAGGNSRTYAYRFTSYVKFPKSVALWDAPEWAKISADHYDEVPYVLGLAYLTREMLLPFDVLDGSDALFNLLNSVKQYADNSYHTISRSVMTLWTNFAKSGNPNRPVRLPSNTPEWPEFDRESQRFMKIGENMAIISTPDKDKLERLDQVLFPVRTRRVKSEKISSV